LFQFNIDRNRDRINFSDGEYKPGAIASVNMIGEKVETVGAGPSPRFKHSASVFRNYLIIHGGRNDAQYNETLRTVALNDLHLLDIKTNTWNTVAIFTDEIPEQRWGHSMVASRHKLMIFGGMNLNQYCESSVFEIVIGK
jgi:hypothetical protein